MYRGTYYNVSGAGKTTNGPKWFHGSKKRHTSWANFVQCDSYAHAIRQWKRTPIRTGYSQIDTAGHIAKRECIRAYRYTLDTMLKT